MQLGDTFVIRHLWIVISDPAKHSDKFIIVNLTSDKNRAGTDCELNVGDHEWITKKTYVSFGDAREVGPKEEVKLIENMAAGTIMKNFPMKPTVLRKIISAARASKALPTAFRCYF
jgi:hypothetical protein